MRLLFWFCVLFIGYTYFGYPLLIKFISCRTKKADCKPSIDEEHPFISVVLAVRNESSSILKKLDNIVQQTYPLHKMEIIVISDGSDDGTKEIVQQWIKCKNYERADVRLIHYDERQGKPSAVNVGVCNAKGDIIVLADARQTFLVDAIYRLVVNFSDPDVGCVSGELLLRDDENSELNKEMGAYWKYEKWIRKTESNIGSVVGVTGSIYALRKSIFTEIPHEALIDDVYEPMSVVLKGKKVIFDESAQAVDIVSKNISQEWKRKVRTLTGNWQLFTLAPRFFMPFGNAIWWKFLSHKICRLLVPFALVLLLLASVTQEGLFYQSVAAFQLAFYFLAICAHFSTRLREFKVINLIYFFMMLNLAVVVGFYYWVTGNAHKMWVPAYNKN